MRTVAVYISWLLALACLPTLYFFLGLIYDALRHLGGWESRPSAWLFYCAGLLGWAALARALMLTPRVPLRAYPKWVGLGLLCGVSSVLWWHIDVGDLHPQSIKYLVVLFAFTGGIPILLVVILLLIALKPDEPVTRNAT